MQWRTTRPRPAYAYNSFTGVPAPAGAGLALFPVFLGLEASSARSTDIGRRDDTSSAILCLDPRRNGGLTGFVVASLEFKKLYGSR